MDFIKKTNQVRRFLSDFLTCLLITIFHFLNYIIYSKYETIFPDVFLAAGLLSVGALFLAILLQIPSRLSRAAIFAIPLTIVFGDVMFEFGTTDFGIRFFTMTATFAVAVTLVFFLREHTNKVLIVTFLAMLSSTFVMGSLATSGPGSSTDTAHQSKTGTLPVIVHLVLDEHTGLPGMTAKLRGGPDIRRELEAFYTHFGFRLYGGAYSQYFQTHASLASALNFDGNEDPRQYLTKRRYGYSLKKNAYLKRLSALGYRINIYQSDYFDLCHSEGVEIRTCQSYRPDNLQSPEIAGLPLPERLRLVLNMYYSSFAVTKLARLVAPRVRSWLAEHSIDLPALEFWHGRVGPLAVASHFDRMTKDISHATDGTAFFAHLLMPHYPYVYTADCSVRSPISSWGMRPEAKEVTATETAGGSHNEYFDQIRCTMRKLETLFAALKRSGTFRNAIIVIHGDHGSRIGMTEPTLKTVSTLSGDDYVAAFSTLFALKAPALPAGTDTLMLPLPLLLDFAGGRDERTLANRPRPTVFVGSEGPNYVSVPLAAFPARAD